MGIIVRKIANVDEPLVYLFLRSCLQLPSFHCRVIRRPFLFLNLESNSQKTFGAFKEKWLGLYYKESYHFFNPTGKLFQQKCLLRRCACWVEIFRRPVLSTSFCRRTSHFLLRQRRRRRSSMQGPSIRPISPPEINFFNLQEFEDVFTKSLKTNGAALSSIREQGQALS